MISSASSFGSHQSTRSSPSSNHCKRKLSPSRCVHTVRQFLGLQTPSSAEVDCRNHKHQDSDTLEIALACCPPRDLANGCTRDFHHSFCNPRPAFQSIPHLDHLCVFSYGLVLYHQTKPKINISVYILVLYRYLHTRLLPKHPITSLEKL